MWGWCGPGMGMGWMWIVPLLLFLVMVGTGMLWWRGFGRPWSGRIGDHFHETPRQILDRRYAGGEITKEEYNEMRSNLA